MIEIHAANVERKRDERQTRHVPGLPATRTEPNSWAKNCAEEPIARNPRPRMPAHHEPAHCDSVEARPAEGEQHPEDRDDDHQPTRS